MPSVLHIFDAHAQDQVIENEDEQTKEISLIDVESDDEDEEFSSRRRFKKRGFRSFREKQSMVIQLFGCTALGQPVRLEVNGFQPFFFLKLPEVPKQTVEKTFSDCRNRLLDEFQAILEHEQKDLIPESCVDFTLVSKKVLYGYTGDREFPFLKLTFKNLAVFRAVRNLVVDDCMRPKFHVYAGTEPLEVFDANLDPLLRFFHLRNISPCGWIQVDTKLYARSGSLTDSNACLEGECDWTQIHPETSPPRTCAPFKMASWDIECYSESGEFPLPRSADKKDGTPGDPVIQIGVVLVQQDNETQRHVFVVKSCDAIEGITVHKFKTEKDMLLGWAAWMELANPDILVGYNTFGFDERYVWLRAQELGIDQSRSFQALSRLCILGKETKLDEKFLSSSALGDNTLYIWSTHGRLQVDLYHYVRRLASLPSYKLDEVAKYYLSGKCSHVQKNPETLFVKTKSLGDVKCGRYICLLDESGEEIFEKAPVVSVESNGFSIAIPDNFDLETDLDECVKWVIVKDDVPPKEIFRLHKEGGPEGRAKVAKYCVQDCDLVVELYKKLDVFNNAMSMANVCSVPVNYIFTRGQGVKIESLIFKDCYQRNMLVVTKEAPSRNQFNGQGTQNLQQESYEGAIVLDPIPGFYMDSPIGVCDFASLYPSTIISENISYDSLVWVKEYTLDGKPILVDGKLPYGSEEHEQFAPPGTQWTDISFDIWGVKDGDTRKNPEKVKKGLRVCRYAQPPDGSKHTLPDIVAKLLAARKAKRKEAEKENDPFRKALLDAEQLAYKLTANSLYGQLGSSTFKIRLQNLAASTTAYGRKQILFAKAAIEEFYGPGAKDPRCVAEITYGDTDSLFVNFHVKNPETGKLLQGKEAIVSTIALTEEAGHLVTQALKYPHDFEFDKVYYPFIIFSKKRYVGNKYDESPDEFKQTSMGIVLKRRDNAPILKTIYGGAIKLLLNERNVEKAVAFVKEKSMELVDGKTSMSQLTITKSLSAKYKPDYIKGDIESFEKQLAGIQRKLAAGPSKKLDEELRRVQEKLREKQADLERFSYPAHKILAERIAERDPGNAPASGERIGFIYVSPSAGQVAPKLQGDRIETPTFIREKGLKPDFRYYIEHQLMNPLGQLFGLIVEQLPGFIGASRHTLASQRETLAIDLLFAKALGECDRQAVREFATQHLGANILMNSDTSVRRSPRTNIHDISGSSVKVQSQTQSSILSFLKPIDPSASYMVTKAIVESGRKQKKDEKKDEKKEELPKKKRSSKSVKVDA
jgi:DNA polymerase elongation subunit (family B)